MCCYIFGLWWLVVWCLFVFVLWSFLGFCGLFLCVLVTQQLKVKLFVFLPNVDFLGCFILVYLGLELV